MFFGLAALAALAALPSAYINATGFASLSSPMISFFVNLLLGLLVQGAISYGVFLSLSGEDPSWGGVLSRGFRRVFFLFLITIIIWLLAIAWIFISVLLVGITSKIVLLAVFMMFLMGVVAARLVCSWAVTIQVCVVEQMGPIASFNRSADLAKGHRWSLFAIFLIVFLGVLAFAVIVSTISGLIFPRYILLMPQVRAAVGFIVGVFGASFFGVMCSVIYYNLRAVKEGLTLDSLADIFD